MRKLLLSSAILVIIIILFGFFFRSDFAGIYQLVASPKWGDDFQLVQIPSSQDGNLQKAYFSSTDSREPKPLLVVLHSWSEDYRQKTDSLSDQAKNANWNYIHPDFRGPNNSIQSCGSSLFVSDIEDAIDYAVKKGNVDESRIHIVGTSGGGYATLVSLMKLNHKINTFQAWVPISDLSAWYNESVERGNKYSKDILNCTGSDNELDLDEAKKRSPLYMDQINNKDSNIKIFAGINDGHSAPVPTSHSINMFNRLISDRGSSAVISKNDAIKLVINRVSPDNRDYGYIQGRKVIYKRSFENIELVLFDGGHEMLHDYAFQELQESS